MTGKTSMTTNDPLIGQQLGDYQIVGVIGRGGMGRVYKGYDEKLQRYTAVKVFDAAGVVDEDMDEYRARFQREARAVARLRHPNIVDVYQFGQINTLYYMAMTLVEGRDLRTILKDHAAAGTRLSHEETLRITSDVAAALDYAHAEGVIHRDVKPSNIMIMADGHAMLTDFGLALNVPEGTIGTTFGTVHYIAPEQAMNSAMAVPQSDLYSLGVVLYEILTGKVPFDDQSAMSVALRHLSDPPPPLRKYNPDITPEVEAMVLRALDKDPERRWPNGDAFVRALENALGITDEDEATRRVVIPDWAKDQARVVAQRVADQHEPKIPPLVVAGANAETISERAAPVAEKDTPPPAKPALVSPRNAPGSQTRHIAVAGVTLAVVVVGVLLLSSPGTGSRSEVTPTAGPVTATDAAVVALDVTDEPTDTRAPADTPTATRRPSSTPTDEPAAAVTGEATEAPTATLTRTPRPSSTPRLTATPTPEPAEAAVDVEQDAQIRLVYDADTLILLNDSDAPADISGITFVQPVSGGRDLEFSTRRWDGGSAALTALPPGDCFQIYTVNVLVGDTPSLCNVRHKWDQASAPRWFWISDDPDALFEVVRGEAIIGECRVGAGECRVDVRRDAE
jgi:serine/threonine protein kinase